MYEKTTQNARDRCYRLLALRPRTEYELRVSLKKWGFPPSVTDEVITGLKERRILNDALFASDWIRWRLSSKAVGKEYLRSELRSRGVDREIAESILLDYDEDSELKVALDLARKRIARRGSGLTWRKLAGFLIRRGFSHDVVTKVCHILVDNGRMDIS